ncbi:MAG: hypothetical protein CMM44_06720 [Rhodospirillaceae bacterium]|nr:hypothetical protein [Rhodospirillaceae bacterium]
MSEIIIALALVVTVEGCLYALFPNGMKKVMEQALATPVSTLRITGLIAAFFGVVLIWFLRG